MSKFIKITPYQCMKSIENLKKKWLNFENCILNYIVPSMLKKKSYSLGYSFANDKITKFECFISVDLYVT